MVRCYRNNSEDTFPCAHENFEDDSSYLWTRSPFIAPLAFAVSRSLAAGTDVTDLQRDLQVVADPVAPSPFPGSSLDPRLIGVGFMDIGAE